MVRLAPIFSKYFSNTRPPFLESLILNAKTPFLKTKFFGSHSSYIYAICLQILRNKIHNLFLSPFFYHFVFVLSFIFLVHFFCLLFWIFHTLKPLLPYVIFYVYIILLQSESIVMMKNCMLIVSIKEIKLKKKKLKY